MARGRAWGNALGGYRRQRRDSKGRFTSGKVGGRARSTAKRARKRYQNRGGKTATTMRTAAKRKYNKNNLNKQLQRNHRATLVGTYAGHYGGRLAGSAIGGAVAGGPGAAIGSHLGRNVGVMASQSALKRSGMLVTDKQFMSASKDDQAAIARRLRNAKRANIAINMAGASLVTHNAMKTNVNGRNGYDLAAEIIRNKKAARARKGRDGMFDYRADKWGIGTLYPAKRNRRGVYNISSMGPKYPFMK